MNDVEELKKDLIARYNMSWDELGIDDCTGSFQEAKDNFKNLIELLVQKSYEAGQNSH